MRTYALLGVALALGLGAAGCGSDEEDASGTTTARVTTSGATTPFSADDVEEAFAAELETGGGGDGGVVDLGTEPPKSITCEKDADARTRWRCRVTPGAGAAGGDVVCIVDVDETTRIVSRRSCGRIDS